MMSQYSSGSQLVENERKAKEAMDGKDLHRGGFQDNSITTGRWLVSVQKIMGDIVSGGNLLVDSAAKTDFMMYTDHIRSKFTEHDALPVLNLDSYL